MPKKRPKLIALAGHIAEARRIIHEQQAWLERLRASEQPTLRLKEPFELTLALSRTFSLTNAKWKRRPKPRRVKL
jgi:hypothetical protein